MKILALVPSCAVCPNRHYYSGGKYECTLVGETIVNESGVAPFCPLADFPASTIANMQATISELREPYRHSLTITILSHVAAKLGVNLRADSNVAIPLKDGNVVFLHYDSIKKIDAAHHRPEIQFVHDGKNYTLRVSEKPELFVQVFPFGADTQTECWTICERA